MSSLDSCPRCGTLHERHHLTCPRCGVQRINRIPLSFGVQILLSGLFALFALPALGIGVLLGIELSSYWRGVNFQSFWPEAVIFILAAGAVSAFALIIGERLLKNHGGRGHSAGESRHHD